jgi:hypothetical protein
LYQLIVRGKVDGCSLQAFEDAAGLSLVDTNGMKDELPPITTFLNRSLALTIELQGILFTAFERLLSARIEGAIASGSYDLGLETLRAESFVVADRAPSMCIRAAAPKRASSPSSSVIGTGRSLSTRPSSISAIAGPCC